MNSGQAPEWGWLRGGCAYYILFGVFSYDFINGNPVLIIGTDGIKRIGSFCFCRDGSYASLPPRMTHGRDGARRRLYGSRCGGVSGRGPRYIGNLRYGARAPSPSFSQLRPRTSVRSVVVFARVFRLMLKYRHVISASIYSSHLHSYLLLLYTTRQDDNIVQSIDFCAFIIGPGSQLYILFFAVYASDENTRWTVVILKVDGISRNKIKVIIVDPIAIIYNYIINYLYYNYYQI